MSNHPYGKMSRKHAKLLWSSLTPKQKTEFNQLYSQLIKGELKLEQVLVDDNESIQRIILSPKDAPSKPTAPFAKHFKQEKE